MGMKVSYICHPCRVCWAEIEGLVDVKGLNTCIECMQKELNNLRDIRVDNVNLMLNQIILPGGSNE